RSLHLTLRRSRTRSRWRSRSLRLTLRRSRLPRSRHRRGRYHRGSPRRWRASSRYHPLVGMEAAPKRGRGRMAQPRLVAALGTALGPPHQRKKTRDFLCPIFPPPAVIALGGPAAGVPVPGRSPPAPPPPNPPHTQPVSPPSSPTPTDTGPSNQEVADDIAN